MDRERLIASISHSIRDERVLAAMGAVDRELFVPPGLRDDAWLDEPLPIGEGQTISQPLVVARMCEHLAPGPDDLVLDVGTGSGYHAAVLAHLGGRVISIERHGALAEQARTVLEEAGIENVTVIHGDGSAGFPEEAPYDAINVAACSEDGPPPDLLMQLADEGRMVVPVGGRRQQLVICRREGNRVIHETGEGVAFVPLVRGR
ncbi:MAG: protein-L-isoaspartate(D-aspartate) O-methyltransferase [Actinomycetota bacterium]|nr:protein-L-isoaspartate(D-aspartate) O-methyltransferase [Actinomycetota bacterium]